jgi:hypothetical protein
MGNHCHLRKKLESLLDGQMVAARRVSYSGEEIHRHDERAAEAWLQAGLKELGIDEASMLGGRIGSDENCLLAWHPAPHARRQCMDRRPIGDGTRRLP